MRKPLFDADAICLAVLRHYYSMRTLAVVIGAVLLFIETNYFSPSRFSYSQIITLILYNCLSGKNIGMSIRLFFAVCDILAGYLIVIVFVVGLFTLVPGILSH